MRTLSLTQTVLLVVLLGGCSEPAEPPTPKTELQPDQTLFKDQRRTLDKAQGVEDTLQEGVQRTDEALEKQE